jgi:hypothetical protein
MRSLPRRVWFAAAAIAIAGCSSGKKKPTPRSTKKSGPTNRLPSAKNAEAWNKKHRPQGPQTFGNLLAADEWITDLDSKEPKTRLTAAKQLGNMGKNAKSALSKLEKLTNDPDPEVAKAVKQAITAINK